VKPIALLLALLTACGGAAPEPDPSAIVEVAYGETGGSSGLTYLDSGPTRIVLARWLELFPNPEYRQHVLRHEMWHAVTRIKTHSTDVTCVSCDNRSPYEPILTHPCDAERQEMRASDPIRVRWAGHFAEVEEAATWWNANVGANVVEAVP